MILSILIIYLLAIFLVSVWANKYNNGVTDFLLAGRRLGVGLGSFTLVATLFGGGMVVGLSEKAFESGLITWWHGIGGGIGFILISFIAFRMRELALFTVPDFIMKRYNSNVLRVISALLSLVALIGILAAQVSAASSILEMFGIGSMTGAVIVLVLFILYTAIGGLWGATMTDFIQIIIATTGVLITSIIVLVKTGGFSNLGAGISSINQSEFLSITGNGNISFLLWLALPLVLYNLIGQDVYQRVFATKDGNTAKRAAFIGGLILMSITVFPVIIGMGARTLFPEITGSEALPTVVSELLPDFVAGIVLSAVMAAIMSTANSILTAGTSHVINDLYLNAFNKKEKFEDNVESDRYLLKMSRLWTVILGVVAIVVSTIIPTIVEILLYSYTLYTAGVFAPVILGFLWKKGTIQGAYASLIVGLSIAVLGIVGVNTGGVPVEVLSALAAFIVYIIISLLTYKNQQQTMFEKVEGEG